ncbi:MAG: type II toxin-antitoxin system PemK/MazF family toxin, partial [Actinobacteria bacterium]|nr:type II toxin-antitoxin system PemK/MazF family toxin [Actinomycetota bacterium]
PPDCWAMAEPIAGAVYYGRDRDLTLPPNDDRQYHDQRRPVSVISGSETNSDASWGFVLMALISSSTSHKTRFCVRLAAGAANLPKKGWVRVSAVQPLMKSQLGDQTGIVTADKLAEVHARLLQYMGLTDEDEPSI